METAKERNGGRKAPGFDSHRKGPQVLAPSLGHVEPGLDDVAQRGEVCAAVGVDHALWPVGGARLEGDGDGVVLVKSLGVQPSPALMAALAVVGEALKDSSVERAA